MENESKRFNISVSAELFEQLSEIQKEHYPECSRNEMLNDLIRKGLNISYREEIKKQKT